MDFTKIPETEPPFRPDGTGGDIAEQEAYLRAVLGDEPEPPVPGRTAPPAAGGGFMPQAWATAPRYATPAAVSTTASPATTASPSVAEPATAVATPTAVEPATTAATPTATVSLAKAASAAGEGEATPASGPQQKGRVLSRLKKAGLSVPWKNPGRAVSPQGTDPSAPQKGTTPPPSPDGPAQSPAPVRKPKQSAAARKKRRRMIRIAVTVLLAAVIGWFLWRRFHGGGGKMSTEVLTDMVQYSSILSTVEGSGITRAKNSETIVIPYAGTVKEVLVEEGDEVLSGDALFLVDSEDARKAIEDAEKAVERANDTVDKANEAVQTARDRVREAEAGITTAQDRVREAEASVTTALDRVRDAEEGVTTAQKRVDTALKSLNEIRDKRQKLKVRAAFDGKLLEVQKLNAGDTVSEGTVIATLADDTRMRLTQYYSYAYVEDLQPGLAVSVSLPKLMSEVSGTVEDIHLVSRVTEEGSRLFSVDIAVQNDGGLSEGMEATAAAMIDGEAVYPYESGKLSYYEKQEVKAEVTGKVLSTALLDYLPVSEGQVLLELDDEDLNEKITDAEKTLDEAEKSVEDARNRVTDAQKGVEDARKNVQTQEKGVEDARKNVRDMQKGVEDALKTVEEDKAAVGDAEKKLEEARKNAEKCNGVAGIDGKVIGLDLLAGQEVTAGKAAMQISDISVIVVNATVDERNISYVKKGMEVNLDQWGTPAIGVIDSISLSSTVTNGVATYPMSITLDNTDGNIQVNSNINYSLVASQNDNCLVVPIQCVRTVSTEDGENRTVVYVQGEEAPEEALENTVSGEEIPEGFWPVPVETGIQDTYNVEIRSGLSEGDVVFTQIQSDRPW